MKRLFILTAPILLALFGSCAHAGHDHDHEGETHETAADHAEGDHDDDDDHEGKESHAGFVEMSHEAVKQAGIAMEKVTAGEFREAVKAAGVIENSLGTERIISAPASGIVSFGSGIVTGRAVTAGQPLFSISSKGLEQSDATATLRIEAEAARKAFERAGQLIKDNLITRTEYDRLRAEYERASASASTVAAKAAKSVGVLSPIAGYLITVNVAPGAFVNMGDPLATVAADRRLMLRAEVSERHREFARQVSGANIRLSGSDTSVSLASLSPRVLSSATATASNSHFLPVYIEFDNPGGLSSGSVVETYLLGPTRQGVISVPVSALVEEGGYFYVYVKQPDEHELFRKAEVKTGPNDGLRVEITSGLNEGETVVTQGAPRIRMAGMGSSIQGHHHH